MKELKNFPERMSQKDIFDKFRDPELIDKLPVINFPTEWNVRLVPAFGNVATRFVVESPHYTGAYISVFLDISNAQGCSRDPFWEIYPNVEGDISRFNIYDIRGLLDAIKESMEA